MRITRLMAILDSSSAPAPTATLNITGLLSTDTVSASDGSNTYTPTWDSGSSAWVFTDLPLNTYTISATRGITVTKTVLIDAATTFTVHLPIYVSVKVTGTGAGGWCCVIYGGTTYASGLPKTFTITNGETVECKIRPARSSATSYIEWNGVTVETGTYGQAKSWYFQPGSYTEINLNYATTQSIIIIPGGD